MADKSITLKELKALREKGAEIEFETEVTQIEQFGELVETLKTIVANEEERVRADIARQQTNLEILATLQSMIRKQGSGPKITPVDMEPITKLLEEIRAEREAKAMVSYEFEIDRDGRGFARKITAKPQGQQIH